jgi:predicted kinase
MQEISYAGQESSVQSSGRKEYRCLVCDGPVERPHLVCRKCWARDRKEQEWESHLDFLDGDDAAPADPGASLEYGRQRGIPPEQPMLVMLCGPSHAGKTTFARKLGGKFTIISSEEIRKRLSGSFKRRRDENKVWGIFESRKSKALKQGQNIVLDACHISGQARRHSLEGPNAKHRKICVVFDLPLQTIRARWTKERRLPLPEVERMWKAFQNSKPTRKELKHLGFDEVYFVRDGPTTASLVGVLRSDARGGGRVSALQAESE